MIHKQLLHLSIYIIFDGKNNYDLLPDETVSLFRSLVSEEKNEFSDNNACN